MDNIIRNAIVTANNLTSSLQETITLSHAITGTFGSTYSSPISHTAIVERKVQSVTTTAGRVVEAKSIVTFIQPLEVKTTDKIVLQDGSTGPILNVEGVDDPTTGKPYMTQVWLG